MSATNITIKPNNHRAHPCPTEKKIELLNKLIEQNSKLEIVIACSQDAQKIQDALENKTIKVIEDKELVSSSELSYEMLISYDLPIKAIVYMARVAKATNKAIILIDSSEQKALYPIEMLLGRAIKQEVLEGFEYPTVAPLSDKFAPKRMSKEKIKEVAKKRYEDKTQEKKPSDKPKREYKKDDKKDFKKSDSSDKWAKKKKEPNKFLGYDENGKAKFSGKSGDRNHRYDGTQHDKYDAPKKVGRKISIKQRKPQ